MASPSEPTIHIPTSCPLARDRDGNTIPLPTGAFAWRVRRKTGGRPRIMLGVDKQPMLLPLGYSIVDVDDVLAPGEYLLDLVDAKGKDLDVIVPIAVGQLRNADGEDEPDDEPTISATLPTTGSETRLVLEANVRATQMAFVHNQKTLELGLKMAETLRDGVRVMAESQAEWIKSLASTKGFFRNAPLHQLPALPALRADDEDDEDDQPAREPSLVDQLAPLLGAVVPQILQSLGSEPRASSSDPGSKVKLELADLLDWRRVEKKRNEAAAAELTPVPTESGTPIGDAVTLMSSLPPTMIAKLAQVKALLSEDEQRRVMELLLALRIEDLPAVVAHIEPMSVDETVAFLRAQLAKTPAA